MQRLLFIVLSLGLLPLLVACNLSPKEEPTNVRPTVPVIGGGDNDPTPTQQIVVVTATSQASPSPTATQFSNGNNGNSGNNNGGNTGGTPRFSDLSFSTSAGGTALSGFAQGVQEIYVRWSYSNVPVGTTVRREWYKDGQLFTSREEAWSSTWGTSGRLTHVKLFDYSTGIASGNYYVVIKLPSYNVQIDGRFSVLSGVPTFASLSFSDSSVNTSKTIFPYGTTDVYARWSYANIPVGATVRRIWYLNGAVYAQRTEAWDAALGSGGTINYIRIYNYAAGGLPPGKYDVVIELPDYPSARVTGSFTIEGNVGPTLSNLRFATTASGTAATSFPTGTQEIFSIFDYANIPLQAQIRRVWTRDGVVVSDRTEAWNFDTYGTNGTVRNISLYDRTNGLATGNWTVMVEIVGQTSSNARTTATFTIASNPVPSISNLRFATTANGTTATAFPTGTQEVFGIFDYANVPSNAQLRRLWYRDSTLVAERTEAWDSATYGSSGTARNISIFDRENGLTSGSYQVEFQLITPSNGTLTTLGTFTIATPPTTSNLRFSDAGNGASITRFAAGTDEVFALFDYTNVPADAQVRRVWYLNDAVYADVTADWDEATYGSSGTARNVSIYDLVNGLPSGNYRVEISFVGFPSSLVTNTFVIDPPAN